MDEDRKFNIKLEQYKLNELSQVTTKELTDEDKEYLDFIESDNRAFFEKFDISKLSQETEQRSKAKKHIKFPRKYIATLATAACFIIALNIFPTTGIEQKEVILLKGATNLNIYLKSEDDISKLKNLDRVTEDSQLQITYLSKEKYGVIFSVDGLNNITYHFPENVNQSTSLDIGKEMTLPTSYTLDNAPYFEKFYMVTSDSSLNIDFVRDSISEIRVSDGKITQELELPTKYNINKIILLKDK